MSQRQYFKQNKEMTSEVWYEKQVIGEMATVISNYKAAYAWAQSATYPHRAKLLRRSLDQTTESEVFLDDDIWASPSASVQRRG